MLEVEASGESPQMGSAGGHSKALTDNATPEINGVPESLEAWRAGDGTGAECLQAGSNSWADWAGES